MNSSRITGVIALTALGALGGVAQAGNWQRDQDARRYEQRYDRDVQRYDRDVDYARVLQVTPLVERVRYSEPVEECFDEARSDGRGNRTGATLLGGMLGAVVGHQIGGGDGRRLATVAGAVVGGAIGNNAAARAEARGGYDDRVRYEERCTLREETRVEERVRGYRVAYRYHGRDYVAELPYDPGPRLRVAVDARPL